MALKNQLEKIREQVRALLRQELDRELEVVSQGDLIFFAANGYWPDGKPRERLTRLWKGAALSPEFKNKTKDEKEFYAVHGHWPEEKETNDTEKPTRPTQARS